jgi:lipoate-protein ligase A
MSPSCRLLPYETATGAVNMAADETLLEAALAGTASLRCYGWTAPTVSLGYFQPAKVWRDDPLLQGLPMVRRPSGGETLVHHHELTYCLALPAGPPWQDRRSWAERMHGVIMAALESLGVSTEPALREEAGPSHLCFQHPTPGDVLVAQAKVVGSAQRKRRGALLQHGAVLLATSPWAPRLPGIRELTGLELRAEEVHRAMTRALASHAGWELNAQDWTAAERQRVLDLAAQRYVLPSWNAKR